MEWPQIGFHLLEQITTRIRQTVEFLLDNGTPNDVVKELANDDRHEATIQSCAGMLLIECNATLFYREFVTSLIETVLNTLTQQPDFIESSEIFWQAI
jgi:hypothetical protein